MDGHVNLAFKLHKCKNGDWRANIDPQAHYIRASKTNQTHHFSSNSIRGKKEAMIAKVSI